MTGDLVMQDEMVDFSAGNPELPNFRGKRSSTRLNDRDWDTEGGWSYTTFENNTTDRPSDGLHNGNGLLTFNTHSGDGTNNYMHQIAMTTNTNKLWHRRRSGGGWDSWEEILKGTQTISDIAGLQTSLDSKAYLDHIRSLGAQYTTGGSSTTISTADFIAELESDGAFDSYSAVLKNAWSYAGNKDLSDAGRFTETAGASFLTWTDNSSDTVLSLIHI